MQYRLVNLHWPKFENCQISVTFKIFITGFQNLSLQYFFTVERVGQGVIALTFLEGGGKYSKQN